jgi:hypothetical protein
MIPLRARRLLAPAGIGYFLLAIVTCLPSAARSAGPKLTPEELAARETSAGEDAVQLLLLSGLAEGPAASRLRQRAGEILSRERKTATAAELAALTDRMATALPKVVHSPAEVKELLGPPAKVARQILFRRYVEQWTYETPLPLLLEFHFRKGQESRLYTVHVNRKQNS